MRVVDSGVFTLNGWVVQEEQLLFFVYSHLAYFSPKNVLRAIEK